jgi:hypothetical protein
MQGFVAEILKFQIHAVFAAVTSHSRRRLGLI